MTNTNRFQPTDEEEAVLDRVNDLVPQNLDLFRDTGRWLDEKYSQKAIAMQYEAVARIRQEQAKKLRERRQQRFQVCLGKDAAIALKYAYNRDFNMKVRRIVAQLDHDGDSTNVKAIRSHLIQLGISVNSRWGFKRLTALFDDLARLADVHKQIRKLDTRGTHDLPGDMPVHVISKHLDQNETTYYDRFCQAWRDFFLKKKFDFTTEMRADKLRHAKQGILLVWLITDPDAGDVRHITEFQKWDWGRVGVDKPPSWVPDDEPELGPNELFTRRYARHELMRDRRWIQLAKLAINVLLAKGKVKTSAQSETGPSETEPHEQDVPGDDGNDGSAHVPTDQEFPRRFYTQQGVTDDLIDNAVRDKMIVPQGQRGSYGYRFNEVKLIAQWLKSDYWEKTEKK